MQVTTQRQEAFCVKLTDVGVPYDFVREVTGGKTHYEMMRYVLLVGCLSSQQHASVSQGRICTDNFTCCHTEIEAADQTNDEITTMVRLESSDSMLIVR